MIPVALRDRHGRLVEFAWVDEADYPAMSQHTWRYLFVKPRARGRAAGHPGHEYAFRNEGFGADPNNYVKIYMHREILGLRRRPGRGCQDLADHLDGNGLDNRRSNLRVVTQTGNRLNRR